MKNLQPKKNKQLYLENEQPRGFALIASLVLVVLLTLLDPKQAYQLLGRSIDSF